MRAATRGLVFATYLAPNIRPVYEYVAERVGAALDLPSRLVTGESYEPIRAGEVDFAFLCGLPYVRLRGEDPSLVEAIAAPVVRGERYGGRPVYFSDVIVPAGSRAGSLADLRGCSWAYNERDSHSGYLATLYGLLGIGETGSFFGRVEKAGYHQESIRLVVAGKIDASAIDSQVLAVELDRDPGLAERVRVVATFGPSTIQPLVATRRASPELRRQVAEIVTSIGAREAERERLAPGLVDRFVPVVDESYDDIRAMLEAVEHRHLTL